MQLVLNTPGLTLAVRNGSFHVVLEDTKRLISPAKISSIAVIVNCLISSEAVRLAARNEIPILFFDALGRAEARLWSPYFGSLADLRRRQIRFLDTPHATRWVIELFKEKVKQNLEVLEWLQNRRPSLSEELDQIKARMSANTLHFDEHGHLVPEACAGVLMGIEGAIARMYWEIVSRCVPESLRFEGRSRQPALDPFNATLNYLYGMLYPEVEGALFAAGLDPHLGVLHVDQYDKPTLAFDLIEPFRPWVDRIILEACLQDKIDPVGFFFKKEGGFFLSKSGKQFFIPLFNDFMEDVRQYEGKRLSNRNHIYRVAQEFANRLRTFEEK